MIWEAYLKIPIDKYCVYSQYLINIYNDSLQVLGNTQKKNTRQLYRFSGCVNPFLGKHIMR